MLDVGVHDVAEGSSKEDFLRKSVKFGIRSDHKHVLVPADQVVRITRLSDLTT